MKNRGKTKAQLLTEMDELRQRINRLEVCVEEKYKILTEHSLTGIFIHQDGKYAFVNQKFADMHGYAPQELIGKKYLDLVHPEERRFVRKTVSDRLKGINDPSNYEVRRLRKNGETLWCEMMAAVIKLAGKPAVMGNVIDITARKLVEDAGRESEERYRNLFEHAGDAIFIESLEGKILSVNEKACELLQYSKDELHSLTVYDITPPSLHKKIPDSIRILKAQGSLLFETQNRCRSGSLVDVEVSARLATLKGEQVALVFVRDVTERKQSEEALRRSKEQLFQAQKMEALGTLVAGVAHEINNPINLIMFNIPLLQKIWHDFMPILTEQSTKEPEKKYGGLTLEFLKENMDQLLSDIDLAANRITRIVKSLKDFAKKSDTTEKRAMGFGSAVENARRLADATLRKAGVTLEVNLEDNLPMINANIQSIEQILLNLIINAVQAIDHEKGEIRITVRFDEGDGRIYVEVADNGPGIDPSIRDTVFDPFVTTRQTDGGTGLGLSVTYNLVKSHNGEITFKTSKDRGTAFTLSFPVKEPKAVAKILVVDDDVTIQQVLAKALSEQGSYAVEEAPNGTEALIKLGTQKPDLLILDILMPEMDGVEVCRVIKDEPELAHIKVILITGYPETPKLVELARLGYTHVLYKPFELPAFLKEVEEVLGN